MNPCQNPTTAMSQGTDTKAAAPTEYLDLEAREAAERIYNLKIHEKTAFELEGYDQGVEILSVPGGWLYRIEDFTQDGLIYSNPVLVPFHKEV